MKRQRKCKKRSCNDSNEQMPHEVIKSELSNTLEEASATQKYVPVFGKNAQPKQQPGKAETEEDVDGQMVKIRKVEVFEIDEDSKSHVSEDGLSQEEYVPENGDKALHHNTRVKEIEKVECLDISNSSNDCIAQEESKGPNQSGNACEEEDIKNQIQEEDEAETSEIESKIHPIEIKLQDNQTLSIEAATLNEKTSIDCSKKEFLKDKEGCEEAKLHLNAAVLPTSHGMSTERESVYTTLQYMANFTEEERDGTKMKDTESVGHSDNTLRVMESDSSKKAEVDDSGGSGFNEKQLGIIEERPRDTIHNTCNNEEKNEIINRDVYKPAVGINLTKNKSIDLVHSEFEGQMKVASRNITAFADPQESALALSHPVINEDKTSTKDLSDLLVSHYSATEHDSATTHSQGSKICNISDAGTSLLPDNGKDIVMTESKKKNDFRVREADPANMQSFVDYDADAMMTDSQINLLDEDILTLPQSSVHDCSVPDINNKKCLESKKTLEDYIADGEHMMKGIIEEISSITKAIVTMKRFIDSVKKHKQTRINTIWKYGKTN